MQEVEGLASSSEQIGSVLEVIRSIAELEQLIERSLAVLSTQGSQVRGIKQAADIMNLSLIHIS